MSRNLRRASLTYLAEVVKGVLTIVVARCSLQQPAPVSQAEVFAVTLHVLNHVSPSQISTFGHCQRKHWLEKIMGLRSVAGAGAEFGSRVHAAIEARIKTGQWSTRAEDADVVKVALSGWKFVPQNRKLRVEQKMRLHGPALPIIGRIDLMVPEDSVIIDHKTSSSFHWMKTPALLKTDPQAIVYVFWAYKYGFLRANSLTFRHIVYVTRGQPEARTVQVQFSAGEISDKFSELEKTIAQMAFNAKLTNPAEIAGAMESADPSPCLAYGGCEHVARCKALLGKRAFSPIENKPEKNKENNMMSIEDLLAKKKARQADEVVAAAGAAAAAVFDVGAVNPPDGTQGVEQVAAETTKAIKEVAPKKDKKVATKPQADLFGKVEKVTAAEAETAAMQMADNEADARAQRTMFPPPDDDQPEPAGRPHAADSMYFDPFAAPTLYVGCLPSNEPFLLLDHWLAPLYEMAAQTLGTSYWNQADFGKGKTALAALVLHKADNEPLPQVLVVDPRLPAADIALEILRPRYKRIVLRFS